MQAGRASHVGCEGGGIAGLRPVSGLGLGLEIVVVDEYIERGLEEVVGDGEETMGGGG